MLDLKSMGPGELSAALSKMGEPSFRGKQLFQWLCRGVKSLDDMSSLPQGLREKLRETALFSPPEIARKQVSKLDGTIKYLLSLIHI